MSNRGKNMKVTIFNGSPKGQRGNTSIIVDRLSQGMTEAGASVEKIYLSDLKIRQCCGCLSCFALHPGRCVIDDDMKPLLMKYALSDLVGFATPLYSNNMTGLLKNFIDRTLPLYNYHMEINDSGNYYHSPLSEKQQKVFVVSNCGFPGSNNFEILRRIFAVFSPIAEIYRSSGMALTADEGDITIYPKRIVSKIIRYKKFLPKAGYEMIKKGFISQKTMMILNEPFGSDMQIQDIVNRYYEGIAVKK